MKNLNATGTLTYIIYFYLDREKGTTMANFSITTGEYAGPHKKLKLEKTWIDKLLLV